MLLLKYNSLPSDELITCESTMLKFLDNKLSFDTGMYFNVWRWSIPELYGILLGMMVRLDLSGCLQIQESEMLDFIIDVEKGYFTTDYHSFYHAVDVVAVLYYMLNDLGAAKYLTSLDSICLMIAGLCHDVGHPGLNNVYQVNARTPLALKYKNESVLENYSCTLTMELLSKHKLFQMDNNSSSSGIDSRCCYSSSSSTFTSPESSPTSTTSPSRLFPTTPTLLDKDRRLILLKVLLHAADLSNTVRPWEISKCWSDCVVEEFFKQGDLEKLKNLPVSPNMDREQTHQSQISLGFGDYVVKPYFEAFALFLNQAKIFLDTLAENRVCWDEMNNNQNKANYVDNVNENDPQLSPSSKSSPPSSASDLKTKSPISSTKPLSDISITPNKIPTILAAGLLIIPDDIQEKLCRMSTPHTSYVTKNRHNLHDNNVINNNSGNMRRTLSGRSYSSNALLMSTSTPSSLSSNITGSISNMNNTGCVNDYGCCDLDDDLVDKSKKSNVRRK
ncbi:8978_t:CDS:2 [Entrophospora sp. SA101]|nr:8978_t:CDS:2 [Entrophospora sp. SA101]CAJ0896145.1 9502_t:CDS:2 [Entrophospora sp. SA101]